MNRDIFGRFASCSSSGTSCAATSTIASCVPLAVDLSGQEWAGLRAEGRGALWWLSSRPWLWPLLQNAIATTRDAIIAEFGVEPTFSLEVSWHTAPAPEASLMVVAPVFECDREDAFDRTTAFLKGSEQGLVSPHVAAIAALQETHFDGVVVQGILVGADMWLGPAASPSAPSVTATATQERSDAV